MSRVLSYPGFPELPVAPVLAVVVWGSTPPSPRLAVVVATEAAAAVPPRPTPGNKIYIVYEYHINDYRYTSFAND